MVADSVANMSLCPITPACRELILAFLARAKSEKLPDGRYELEGDNLFALVQRYASKPLAGLQMESHILYADLQVILSGSERMLWAFAGMLKIDRDLRPESDMIFYREAAARGNFILDAGMYAYFAPGDAHMPCVQKTENCPEAVEKIVFKIRQ
jgi:biofilm protein TabA